MQTSEIKILHLDTNHPILLNALQDAGFTNHEDYSSTKEQIQAKISAYHGIVIRSRFNIDKEFLEAATNLQFIARVGAGLESIDCEYAEAKNIQLIAAPEGNRNAVGEHSLAMLLALFNKIITADRQVKLGQWNREQNRGVELDGKTVGIIGYGNMGKAFAKKLRGFEVNVLCCDILPNVGDANAKQVSLEQLQKESDVLSLHIPWTPETDKMVNSGFIQKFKKPFWLINTSRGKNVVTQDLVLALKSGKIFGAGLDVIEYEKSSFESMFEENHVPEALKYLLQSDNVILSPHIAGWTLESKQRLAETIGEKIIQKYNPTTAIETKDVRVTGVGGFFFKSQNPKELATWYNKFLGLDTNDYGCTFWWNDERGIKCSTQWSPFASDTQYFNPSEKQFMQNFRVENLEKLLKNLQDEGVTVVGEMESYDYGKFGWILDPEGNKIELWEPIDKVFL